MCTTKPMSDWACADFPQLIFICQSTAWSITINTFTFRYLEGSKISLAKLMGPTDPSKLYHQQTNLDGKAGSGHNLEKSVTIHLPNAILNALPLVERVFVSYLREFIHSKPGITFAHFPPSCGQTKGSSVLQPVYRALEFVHEAFWSMVTNSRGFYLARKKSTDRHRLANKKKKRKKRFLILI